MIQKVQFHPTARKTFWEGHCHHRNLSLFTETLRSQCPLAFVQRERYRPCPGVKPVFETIRYGSNRSAERA